MKKTSQEYWDIYLQLESDLRNEIQNHMDTHDSIRFDEEGVVTASPDDLIIGMEKSPNGSVEVLIQNDIGAEVTWSLSSDTLNAVDLVWIFEQLTDND